MNPIRRVWMTGVVVLWAALAANASESDPGATLKIDASRRVPHAIPAYITGKFAEHLGSNIYNGMSAQILRNPTFASFPFWTGGQDPDGRTYFHSDGERIAAEIRRLAARLRLPDGEADRLMEARSDGLAFWWQRVGARDAVRVSPDVTPHGNRAQRIELRAIGEGIAQWIYLPLHRVRKYEFELYVRSPGIELLSVALFESGAARPRARATLGGLSAEWQTLRGELELDPSAPADALYRLELTGRAAGQLVIGRFQLWPADHVNGADADVVRMLKESRLPILRWPGGNFVSGYHWEDGVGPAETRRTVPNWAWGGVEPNLFGTHEFIAFCRAVGCEPMICINAGDGTPEEAARWVEYCNGPATSPMGARRAANGNPEPFNIRHWEVGNELWGKWQVGWTTPAGNVDRYKQFAPAMLKADPTILLYACGAPVLWGREWNQALFRGVGPALRCTTDHPLIGGNVPLSTDPLDVYRNFMAVPDVLERRWGQMRQSMREAGVPEPRLAVTELQLFAHLGPRAGDEAPRLTGANLVNPATHAEALYDTLLYHAVIRLAPFVEMVTHSATVNHGGGLRKERERVYANPCHHAQSMFSAFAGATPVEAELSVPTEKVPVVLPDIRSEGKELEFAQIAALAARSREGELLISLVNRGTSGPIPLRIELEGFAAAGTAQVQVLAADVPWAVNTLDNPDRVRPSHREAQVRDGRLELQMPPFSIVQVRLPVRR